MSKNYIYWPEKSYFNSANLEKYEIEIGNGTLGNGATDVRLFYNNKWYDFDSLKSRIIVAGAGGSNIASYLGDKSGVCIIGGNYGYAGGLNGYEGIHEKCDPSIEMNVAKPGKHATQTKGGKGGERGLCPHGGYDGEFGSGGIQGLSCRNSNTYRANDGYTGSGGYYGSGGSAGGSAGYSSPLGSGGGSSFISGHRGCDAININSTEDEIIHTGLPWHYSGIEFGNSIMIDGSGKRWKDLNLVDDKIPKPILNYRQYYPAGTGHSGDGFIMISVLKYSPLTCNLSVYLSHIFCSLLIIPLIKL